MAIQDFKYYFNDFLDKGINLLRDDMSWLEFNMILDGIFLQEHSCIGKVIGYRTYEKPPHFPYSRFPDPS